MTEPLSTEGGGLDLQKKIGPFPLWVWVVGVGGGLFVLMRRGGPNFGGSTDEDTTPRAVVYTGTGGSDGSGVSDPQLPNDPTIETNEDWFRAASEFLLATNRPPALIDSALRKYLAGQSVTANEQALINEAIRGVGPVPQVLPPIDSPDPDEPGQEPPSTPVPPGQRNPHTPPSSPPSTPDPPPSGPRTVQPSPWRVRPGDSLWKIARMALRAARGREPSDAQVNAYWRSIYSRNRDKISNPNLIYPGQVFRMPPIAV